MRRLLIPAAIATTLLAWASAFLVIRVVAPYVNPGALTLGRVLVGAAALGVAVLVRRHWVKPTRRGWILLAVFGVGWFGIYNIALNAAEHYLDPGTAALVVNVAALIVPLAAGVILGEGFPCWLLVGAAVAFWGVVLISFATSTGQRSLGGVLLALLAAVTYAAGVLAQKSLLSRLPSLQVTFLGAAIGVVACLPWSGVLVRDVAAAPLAVNLGIVYLGLVPTALAFLTWSYALAVMPAGRLTTLTLLVPVITTLVAWPLLNEIPPPLALAGGLLCLAGVALTRLPARPSQALAAPPS